MRAAAARTRHPGTPAPDRGLARGLVAGILATLLLPVALAPAAGRGEPEQPNQHHQAARAALAAGNLGKATVEAKLALQDDPLDAASHLLLGALLERQGQRDQAVVGFQRALVLEPTNPEALYNLGTLLLQRGEAVSASGLLEKAVSIRPDHVPAYNNLAKAYFQAGLPELTVAAYEEALRRDPSNAVALGNLMRLAEAQGLDDASASYRRRLEAAGSGRGAKPAVVAGEQVAQLPTWPLATRPVGTPSAPQFPDASVLAPPSPPDEEAEALRELLRGLAQVTVERRAGRLTVTGWVRSQQEKELLDRALAGRKDVLDLTTDDVGDAQRMLEVDATILIQYKIDQASAGFNFLQLVQTSFSYFASDHSRDGTGYQAPGAAFPGPKTPASATIGAVTAPFQAGWIFGASVDYAVNIANTATQHVAVLARPHLTTLSGTPATFLSGGEIVFKVSGINSGDIKPYPFGTTIKVTPTLLRTLGEDGRPRVRMKVEAGRTSVIGLLEGFQTVDQVSFDKVAVTSETVVGLGQTLILSGLSQRESRTGRSGVPGLMHIPVLKYLFSTKSTVETDSAVIILLTPRDPAFMDQQNRAAIAQFVEKRRAYLQAMQGSPEDLRRFHERYPDWAEMAPNRFASHFFLMRNSAPYRAVSGQDLVTEALELDLLVKKN